MVYLYAAAFYLESLRFVIWTLQMTPVEHCVISYAISRAGILSLKNRSSKFTFTTDIFIDLFSLIYHSYENGVIETMCKHMF